MAKKLTKKQLNQMDARQRKTSRRKATSAVKTLLDNTDGFRRIKQIPAEEFEQAQEEDKADDSSSDTSS